MDKYPKNRQAAYGRYWLLVELLASKFEIDEQDNDEIVPTFSIHLDTIKQRLGIFHDTSCLKYAQCIHEVGLMSLKIEKRSCLISFPKLLEVMGRDDKRARKGRGKNALEEKRRDKKRREEIVPAPLAPLFSLGFCMEPSQDFIDTFGSDITDKHWVEAATYHQTSGNKKPFGKFMYDNLTGTIKKFGSRKADQERLEEIANEWGA